MKYIKEHDPYVRVAGMQGLANLCYLASIEQKRAVMRDLPAAFIHEQAIHADIAVRSLPAYLNALIATVTAKYTEMGLGGYNH